MSFSKSPFIFVRNQLSCVMRYAIILIFISFVFPLCAQWQGDVDKYEIFEDSLHLNEVNSVGSTAFLSKSSNIIENATWEFQVDLVFNPSGSNYACVYVVSDNEDLSANGYFVRIGGDSDDRISLCRQDNGVTSVIIDGSVDAVNMNSVDVAIKVMRVGGIWQLYTDNDGFGYSFEGEVTDNTYNQSSYFGVKSVYSKTRADLFSYSHFSIVGTAFVDTIVPRLLSIQALTKYKCQLVFNELINVNSLSYNNEKCKQVSIVEDTVFAVFATSFLDNDSNLILIDVEDENGNVFNSSKNVYYEPFEVVHVDMKTPNTLVFRFNKEAHGVSLHNVFLNNTNPSYISQNGDNYSAVFFSSLEARELEELLIEGVLDINGDTLDEYHTTITYYQSEYGDVVFNEIMADPEPVVGDLPEVEYLELYNNSPFSIHLDGWKLIKDDDKVYTFPEYEMPAGQYLLIGSNASVSEMPDSVHTLAFSSFPSLINSGMLMQLKCSDGEIVDYVEYTSDWYEDDFKASGGFSLERIDVNNLSQIDNWLSSCSDNGGTPGIVNCIAADNPDLRAPQVEAVYAMDEDWIMVQLSEPVLCSGLLDFSHYSMSDDLIINGIKTSSEGLTSSFMLKMSSSMSPSKVYALTISEIEDLSGNVMDKEVFEVALCALPDVGDIVINEIMFYPFSGQAEYVELYNNSDVPFDLSKLIITQKTDNDGWESGKKLSELPALFMPHDYWVVTDKDDVESLLSQYDIDENKIVAICSFPSLNNECDNIGLLLPNATVIDLLCYCDTWHSPLLNDTRGVALERVNADMATNDSTNWFSASSLDDYGTPGKENSQHTQQVSIANQVALASDVFTPDGDGVDDFTLVEINEDNNGGTVRIQIYNRRGIRIRELCNNALIGANSYIRWDGSDDRGKRCPMGSYIILVEIIRPNGDVITEKLECVVSLKS